MQQLEVTQLSKGTYMKRDQFLWQLAIEVQKWNFLFSLSQVLNYIYRQSWQWECLTSILGLQLPNFYSQEELTHNDKFEIGIPLLTRIPVGYQRGSRSKVNCYFWQQKLFILEAILDLEAQLGPIRFTVWPPGVTLWKHKICHNSFNNGRIVTKCLW
jgi:hypothetical protein